MPHAARDLWYMSSGQTNTAPKRGPSHDVRANGRRVARGAGSVRPARQDGQASGRRVDRPRWLCALARLRSGRRGGRLGYWHQVPHPHASGAGRRGLARARRARRGVRTAQSAALLPRPARARRHPAARVRLCRRRQRWLYAAPGHEPTHVHLAAAVRRRRPLRSAR